MHIDIITVHPGLLEGPFSHSILKRAIQKNLVEINIINLRDYATNKHKSVDDYAFGGGAGMVMMIEPIDHCIKDLKS
ncbi:MAG TPA: tRNA (guanosine(37)-N1)-methyltransferase TrmD, partial [Bacteroidia bacterium]|nr:tRNA (guanosine(37)-N1)-methyltransferase TrmD [Bacteroidia bacterium]